MGGEVWLSLPMVHNRLVVTSVGKVAVGRLRPNFIDVCDPDFCKFNCTDEQGLPVYMTFYECARNAVNSR